MRADVPDAPPEGDTPTDDAANTPIADPKQWHTRLHVSMERKGRGGKTATIVSGFNDLMPDEELQRLASDLKQKLGTGGSARGGEILIQGDRRADVTAMLRQRGYKV